MNILVTGATGYIGKEIGKALVRKGHRVFALTRNARRASLDLPFPAELVEGDLTSGPMPSAKFSQIEAVIHLAGENVGDGRWSESRKQKIMTSRSDFTKNLISSLPQDLKVFISASATGIYGNRRDEVLTESSLRGEGFLSDVCLLWEGAIEESRARIPNARIVILRTGVVFSPYGGALMKMLLPFQMGVGGVLGSGHQWMSWIHLQDLVHMYMAALESSSWSGVYNAVAPHPVTNREFTEVLTKALGVRKGPPVPALALKTLYGEMSSVILDSQRVQSERLETFKFHYADLPTALQDSAAPYRDGQQILFAEQYFPLKREQVFSFFAKAENLEKITPPLLSFHVEKMSTASIQKGTLIDYKLKIRGVPAGWTTLIDEWEPNVRFVDTQLKGPYKKWYHTHSFEDLGSGTLMTDVVQYKLPVGKLGQLLGGALVRGDVEKIFAFRREVVPTLLG